MAANTAEVPLIAASPYDLRVALGEKVPEIDIRAALESGDCGFVVGIAANVEQTAVHARMKGLYATVKHFRKAGEIADVPDGEAGVAKGAGRSTC